ncbi:MAG: hypothetical protein ACK5V3_16550, partial [Bdellovibrionales bacterium]
EKLKFVLRNSIIFGVQTNIPYLLEILSHPEFVSGKMTTRFIEKNFSEPLLQPEPSDAELALIKSLTKSVVQQKGTVNFDSPFIGPWREQ